MKKAIIIGASSGIGVALCKELVRNNYQVIITGRRIELLQKISAQCPAQIAPLRLDVTDQKEVEKAMSQWSDQDIDLMVYCAGRGELNPDLEYRLEQSALDVNTDAFVRFMIFGFHYFERKNAGHLVNISSIAGLRGNAVAPAYNASKAFQINYLEGLKQKKNKQKLKFVITDIRPGFVNTAMARGEGLFWVAEPEKAACQIFRAIRKKKPTAYVSRRWSLIAWILKLIPASLYVRL